MYILPQCNVHSDNPFSVNVLAATSVVNPGQFKCFVIFQEILNKWHQQDSKKINLFLGMRDPNQKLKRAIEILWRFYRIHQNSLHYSVPVSRTKPNYIG